MLIIIIIIIIIIITILIIIIINLYKSVNTLFPNNRYVTKLCIIHSPIIPRLSINTLRHQKHYVNSVPLNHFDTMEEYKEVIRGKESITTKLYSKYLTYEFILKIEIWE